MKEVALENEDLGEGWRINMVCCTQVILNEVGHKECTQRDVALSYALAIKSAAQKADTPDWRAINTAIIERWSMAGLERIKKAAMDLCMGKVSPENVLRRKRTTPAHDEEGKS